MTAGLGISIDSLGVALATELLIEAYERGRHKRSPAVRALVARLEIFAGGHGSCNPPAIQDLGEGFLEVLPSQEMTEMLVEARRLGLIA